MDEENLLDSEGRIASGRDTDVTPAALDGDPSLAEKSMASSMAPPIAVVRGNFFLSTLTAASTIFDPLHKNIILNDVHVHTFV